MRVTRDKFKVPGRKFKVRRRALNFELATWNLELYAFSYHYPKKISATA